MNLCCQHCGEQIVARSFGKCPGCLKELPEELQLSAEERRRAETLKKQGGTPLDFNHSETGYAGSLDHLIDFNFDLGGGC